MAGKVAKEPDHMRRQGAGNHAAGDVDRQRAVGDPEWEGGLESKFGRAANAFNVYAREHVRGRERAFNNAGDRRNGIGDTSHSGATDFEESERLGEAAVRRVTPS